MMKRLYTTALLGLLAISLPALAASAPDDDPDVFFGPLSAASLGTEKWVFEENVFEEAIRFFDGTEDPLKQSPFSFGHSSPSSASSAVLPEDTIPSNAELFSFLPIASNAAEPPAKRQKSWGVVFVDPFKEDANLNDLKEVPAMNALLTQIEQERVEDYETRATNLRQYPTAPIPKYSKDLERLFQRTLSLRNRRIKAAVSLYREGREKISQEAEPARAAQYQEFLEGLVQTQDTEIKKTLVDLENSESQGQSSSHQKGRSKSLNSSMQKKYLAELNKAFPVFFPLVASDPLESLDESISVSFSKPQKKRGTTYFQNPFEDANLKDIKEIPAMNVLLTQIEQERVEAYAHQVAEVNQSPECETLDRENRKRKYESIYKKTFSQRKARIEEAVYFYRKWTNTFTEMINREKGLEHAKKFQAVLVELARNQDLEFKHTLTDPEKEREGQAALSGDEIRKIRSTMKQKIWERYDAQAESLVTSTICESCPLLNPSFTAMVVKGFHPPRKRHKKIPGSATEEAPLPAEFEDLPPPADMI